MPGKRGRRTWGHVHKERSGRYTARIPVPDAPGQYQSIGTFASEKRADDALAVARAQVVGGTWVDPARGQRTVAEYVAEYIATTPYKPRSAKLNGRLLAEYIAAELPLDAPGRTRQVIDLGARSLRSVTKQDVRGWHAALRAETRRRAASRAERAATSPQRVARAIREFANTEGLEVAATGRIPATVRAAWEHAGGMRLLTTEAAPTAGEAEAAQAYRLLHAAFERAANDELIPANPCRVAKGGQYDTPRRRPATVAEVAAIAAAMPRRYQAAVWLAALSSIRSGEAFALQRRDWVAATRTLWIERAVELEAEAADFGTVKTTGSKRSVTVPPQIADRLDAHIAEFTGRSPQSLIFTTSSGGIVFPDRIGRPFERARHLAGRDDLTWHDLRHTGQSLAAAAGASVRELQARSGHSTTSAALRYIHDFGDPTAVTADRLEKLLDQ